MAPSIWQRRGFGQKKTQLCTQKSVTQHSGIDYGTPRYVLFRKRVRRIFDRWFANENRPKDQKLRDSKKQILEQLAENMDIRGLKVIEIGCFIGDLPGYLNLSTDVMFMVLRRQLRHVITPKNVLMSISSIPRLPNRVFSTLMKTTVSILILSFVMMFYHG